MSRPKLERLEKRRFDADTRLCIQNQLVDQLLRERSGRDGGEALDWNERSFGWPSRGQAREAQGARDELVGHCAQAGARMTCGGSKLSSPGRLSPGCQACIAGKWSCFFLNRSCTAACFFCPFDRKLRDFVPEADGIKFSDLDDYLEYLERFGFTGVGFSGGEPFLQYELLLAGVRAVKKRFGRRMYVWAYTNGDLVTRERLEELREAGLDELRFDLSARAYRLEPVRLAREVLSRVAVEIPAVPEDKERLKELLSELDEIGVNWLNVHQLFVTPFNKKHFEERGYTFIGGPSIAILESELAALELVAFASGRKLRFPVHYCSAIYKSRHQPSSLRKRLASRLLVPGETLTRAGFIREISSNGGRASREKFTLRYWAPAFQKQAASALKRSLCLEQRGLTAAFVRALSTGERAERFKLPLKRLECFERMGEGLQKFSFDTAASGF